MRIRFCHTDGRIARVSGSGKTKTEALRNAKDEAKLRMDEQVAAQGMTLSASSTMRALFEKYLNVIDLRDEHNQVSSRNNAKRVIRVHLMTSPLAELQVRQITSGAVARFYLQKCAEGKETTGYQAVCELRKVLDYAIEMDICAGNVARQYNLKRPKKTKKYVPTPLSISEWRGVVQAYMDRPDRSGPRMSMVMLDVCDVILGTSYRIGEV